MRNTSYVRRQNKQLLIVLSLRNILPRTVQIGMLLRELLLKLQRWVLWTRMLKYATRESKLNLEARRQTSDASNQMEWNSRQTAAVEWGFSSVHQCT